ncbi:MAG: 16S rRNA (cytidine(1402)-2'-O)-methyltransferase [Elusimicrobiales bacterium]
MPAVLRITATPLGNLEDISPRCARVLREAEIVFCEDTRRTLALLRHLGSPARVLRYNENDDNSVSRCAALAARHENTALVCDGGTPCVSDPGWKLAARFLAEGGKVESVPGPCAAAAAFSASGFPSGAFVFLGFMPRKKSKMEKMLRAAAALGRPLIIYESPFRVKDTLEAVISALGARTRVALAREMTKLHEEWLRGPAEDVLKELSSRDKILGEITLIALPPRDEDADI